MCKELRVKLYCQETRTIRMEIFISRKRGVERKEKRGIRNEA
jgi:hypothetical protein